MKYEFVSSIDLINPAVVWAIYFVVGFYVFFEVIDKKKTCISYLILAAGFQGVFEYVGFNLGKLFPAALYIYILWNILYKAGDKYKIKAVSFFVIFTVCYSITWFYHGIEDVLGYGRQYILYSMPFVIFLLMDRLKNRINLYKELDIAIVILNAQILASVLKLLLHGFNEKMVGTITVSGAGIASFFPVIYFMIIWFKNKKSLSKKDIILIICSLLVPIASNKRAVWFMFPLTLLAIYFIHNKFKMNIKIVTVSVLTLFIFVLGVKLNPTLNPEGKLWGSFNIKYVTSYVLEYSTSDINQLEATSRIGSIIFYLKKLATDFYDTETLFGIGNKLFKKLDARGENAAYLLNTQNMYQFTCWVDILVRFGSIVMIPFTIFIFILFLSATKHQNKLIFLVIFAPWYIFYSASIISHPLCEILFFLAVFYSFCIQSKNNIRNESKFCS